MNNKKDINKLCSLIQYVNNLVSNFEATKTRYILQIEDLCEELNIDIESIREEDVLGYVDAVDYGRGFNKRLFLSEIKRYIKNG